LKWTLIIFAATVLIHLVKGGNDREMPAQLGLDLCKPFYSAPYAIVCPLGVLIASSFAVRTDHGPEAIVDLYPSALNLKSKE
jgi:hypothetical protein